MWKKLCLSAMALIGMLSVGYGYYNVQMKAVPVAHPYYTVGDKFERTQSDKIKFAGQTWNLVYADQASGKGYLLSATSGVRLYGCSGRVGEGENASIESTPSVLNACLTQIRNSYQPVNPDDTAVHINKISNNENF